LSCVIDGDAIQASVAVLTGLNRDLPKRRRHPIIYCTITTSPINDHGDKSRKQAMARS
jgi:hypothetical protein